MFTILAIAQQLFSRPSKRTDHQFLGAMVNPPTDWTRASGPTTTMPPEQLALLMATAGNSPLELSVAVVKNGKLAAVKRWLLAPTLTYGHERWTIYNTHGLSYRDAGTFGVKRERVGAKI